MSETVDSRPPESFRLASVAATAALWLSLAALVLMLRQVRPGAVIAGARLDQAGFGLLGGVLLAAIQLALLKLWPSWRAFTRESVRGIRLGTAEILAIAGMVSVTEELLFRAALQPLVGLWIAAGIFALVHMRFDRKAWAGEVVRFGIVALMMLYLAGLGFGLLYQRAGLGAATTAHFVYDVVMLLAYRWIFASRDRLDA